jgi:hypothetical protein
MRYIFFIFGFVIINPALNFSQDIHEFGGSSILNDTPKDTVKIVETKVIRDTLIIVNDLYRDPPHTKKSKSKEVDTLAIIEAYMNKLRENKIEVDTKEFLKLRLKSKSDKVPNEGAYLYLFWNQFYAILPLDAQSISKKEIEGFNKMFVRSLFEKEPPIGKRPLNSYKTAYKVYINGQEMDLEK